MASKRSILVLLAAATIAFLAGCGGGSTANVQNPPPPPPSNLSIAFQPEPGGTLAVSFTENLTAVGHQRRTKPWRRLVLDLPEPSEYSQPLWQS